MAKKSDAGSSRSSSRTPHSDGPSPSSGEGNAKGRSRQPNNSDEPRSSQGRNRGGQDSQNRRSNRSDDRNDNRNRSRDRRGGDRSQNRSRSGIQRPPSRPALTPEHHPFGPPAHYYDDEPQSGYDSRDGGGDQYYGRAPEWTDQYYEEFFGSPPSIDYDLKTEERDDGPRHGKRDKLSEHSGRARRSQRDEESRSSRSSIDYDSESAAVFPGDYDDFYGPPARDEDGSRKQKRSRDEDQDSRRKSGSRRDNRRADEERDDSTSGDRRGKGAKGHSTQEETDSRRDKAGKDDRKSGRGKGQQRRREDEYQNDVDELKPQHARREDSRKDEQDEESSAKRGSDKTSAEQGKKPKDKAPKHAKSEGAKEDAPAADGEDLQDDADRKPLHAQREAPPPGETSADETNGTQEGKGKRGKSRGKSSRRTADTRRMELPKIKISREFPSQEDRDAYLEATTPLPLDAWSDTPNTVRELILRVERQMQNELAVERGSRVILAVSGGVDSTVMLDIMVELAFRNNYELFVAHFNHRLRGDKADSDEEFVRTRAQELALPFIGGAADINTYASRAKISVEQASRDVRYRFLEQVARKSNASLVATAHTANDTVETLLLNLVRGTGLTGLSGIPARRRFTKDCSLIRPFLNTKKDELEAYAGARGINWREDESNNLMLFTRNKIRHDLLPHLEADYSPAIVDILLRTSRLLNGADKAVTQMVERSVQRIVKTKGNSRITLLIAALKAHSEFLQGELLQRIIQKQFHILPMPIAAVDRLLALMDGDVGSRTDISGRLFGLKDRETIIIAEKQPAFCLRKAVEKGQEIVVGNHKLRLSEVAVDVAKYENNPNVEFLDMETTPRRMTLRTWEPGDSFKPLGMRGNMKISDFLTNQKVPLIDKQHQLVLSTSRDILWVVGHRISNDFRVAKGAKTALKVEWSEVEEKN